MAVSERLRMTAEARVVQVEQHSGVRWKEATGQRGPSRTPDPPLVGELRRKYEIEARNTRTLEDELQEKIKKLKFKRCDYGEHQLGCEKCCVVTSRCF